MAPLKAFTLYAGSVSTCRESCVSCGMFLVCRLAMAVEVEKCADGLLASTDCDLPDNFIHFTGSSKPSQEHDSDSELALKLNTLLEVRPADDMLCSMQMLTFVCLPNLPLWLPDPLHTPCMGA